MPSELGRQWGWLLELCCSVPVWSSAMWQSPWTITVERWGGQSHTAQVCQAEGELEDIGVFLSHPTPPPLLLFAALPSFPFEEECVDVSGQRRESIKGVLESLGGDCLQQQRRHNYCNNCPTNHSQETPLNLIECEGRLETQDPLLYPPLPEYRHYWLLIGASGLVLIVLMSWSEDRHVKDEGVCWE